MRCISTEACKSEIIAVITLSLIRVVGAVWNAIADLANFKAYFFASVVIARAHPAVVYLSRPINGRASVQALSVPGVSAKT